VLSRREAAERNADHSDQVVAGEVGRRHTRSREVGVDGIGETAGEHRPVASIDAHRVLHYLLTDEGPVFEPPNA
jgi:hypothetical protein